MKADETPSLVVNSVLKANNLGMKTTTSGRVVSPENVLDTRAVFEASPNKPPLNQHAPYANAYYGEPEQRVTIWNRVEQRKLSGNSAPFRKNLGEYIRKHPEWELYAGQDKEGYVPGANLVPPQRAPSRQSPTSSVPRERESRRVAVQQQRERERQQRREAQLMAGGVETENLRSPGHRSPRSSQASPRAHKSSGHHEVAAAIQKRDLGEAAPATRAAEGYRHAVGRESEAPLRLQDTTLPTVLPSLAEAAAQRAREMMARRQKLGGETEAVVEKGPATSKEQLWDEEWKAAQVKVAEANAKQAAALQAASEEDGTKRKAEHETGQVSAIEASAARIERFKRRKEFCA